MTANIAQNAEIQPETPGHMPTSPEALMARLDGMGISYTLYHHAPIFTSAEGQMLKDQIPGMHIKNLFLRDKKERMSLVVIPYDLGLDMKLLAPAIGLDRISFGSPDRLWQYLGVRPGSVCPFAAVNDTENQVEVVIHKAAAESPLISVHPLLNSMSLAISGPDVVRFLEATGHTPRILDLNPYARAAA